MMVHPRHREGWTTLTVHLAPIDGSMGIGLDAAHAVTAMYRGGAAERDGQLQVRASSPKAAPRALTGRLSAG